MNSERDVKVNKKSFSKHIGDKRKIRENVGPMLNEIGDLVTQHMEVAELGQLSLSQPLPARSAFRNPKSQRPGERLEQVRCNCGRGSDQGILT